MSFSALPPIFKPNTLNANSEQSLVYVSKILEKQSSVIALDSERSLLTDEERKLSAGLMRVNHVGEVCAQALYEAQALSSNSPALKMQFQAAAQEERRHLEWTSQRLVELGARPSLLNPLWFGGAFALGLVAGYAGDQYSLGFVAETEKQVERHLRGHLESLPLADTVSRDIVERMRQDEAAHEEQAIAAGAVPLPRLVQWAMRLSSRVMTRTARII